MSRYVPSPLEQAAIDQLVAAGWVVVRRRTYDNLKANVDLAQWQLAFELDRAQTLRAWAETAHAGERRMADRLTAVAAGAAAAGVPFDKIQEAMGETNRLGQRANVGDHMCGLYYATSEDQLLTAICILPRDHDVDEQPHSNDLRRAGS